MCLRGTNTRRAKEFLRKGVIVRRYMPTTGFGLPAYARSQAICSTSSATKPLPGAVGLHDGLDQVLRGAPVVHQQLLAWKIQFTRRHGLIEIKRKISLDVASQIIYTKNCHAYYDVQDMHLEHGLLPLSPEIQLRNSELLGSHKGGIKRE